MVDSWDAQCWNPELLEIACLRLAQMLVSLVGTGEEIFMCGLCQKTGNFAVAISFIATLVTLYYFNSVM